MLPLFILGDLPLLSGFHPEGIIWGGGGGGGGELQEVGVALYTFLYNCPKFWGEASSPPLWMKSWLSALGHLHILKLNLHAIVHKTIVNKHTRRSAVYTIQTCHL